MFVPWSPSPIAASSWTRWSRSARTATSISRIQEVIVAASMTLALINLDTPTQCRGVHRRVPELCQLFVELEHRQRRAGHLERCDVASDQVARRLHARGAELLVDLSI